MHYTPMTSDSPLGAASHVPVSGGHPGAIQAGLRKRRTGWSSGLPRTSSAVSTECGSTADLLHEIRGSHHRCSCLPSLAKRPGADRFQGRCADVQSFTRKCAAVSGTTRSCCQSSRPTDITLRWHHSSDSASSNRRPKPKQVFPTHGIFPTSSL